MNKKYIMWIGVLVLLIGGYLIADKLLFDGITPREIEENGFYANYFVDANSGNKTAVILIGGGQWGDFWGSELAKEGYVGLSLPYTRQHGLPALPEEIPLEYFQKALTWLQEQAEVNPEKILVMGASRNAELALVIASYFPEVVSGVIAYAPSAVSWSNTVLPFNSDEVKPSWKFQDQDVPYISMPKIAGNDLPVLETLSYWKDGLAKTDQLAKAAIPVEKIQGPILLFSGKDDKVWPAALMADMIENRLSSHNFQFPVYNVQYDNAGHQISGNPRSNSELRKGSMNIDGKQYEFEFGGTSQGDSQAKIDGRSRLLEFLNSL